MGEGPRSCSIAPGHAGASCLMHRMPWGILRSLGGAGAGVPLGGGRPRAVTRGAAWPRVRSSASADTLITESALSGVIL